MTRLELFRQNAREFNNLSDDTVNGWFSTALLFIDDDYDAIPTGKQDLAVALLAAHFAWLSKYPGQGGASRGPILNESDDRIGAKKQYALLKNSDTFLQQSFYGQFYYQLTGLGGVARSAILTRFGVD